MQFQSTSYDLTDSAETQEFFHSRGWTDGFPIVPPTPTAVQNCLEWAGMPADQLIGLHPGQSTNGTAALIAEKVRAVEFLNATDVDGVYDSDPSKNKKAKKFARINIKDLRTILVREDSMAGGYDLMDIVALKVIERSKIKTKIIKADIKTIEKAMKGQPVGTQIVP